MKRTFVDSSHWIGAFSKKDKWKEEGKKFIEWFEEQDPSKSKIIITYGEISQNSDFFGIIRKLFITHVIYRS